MIRHSLTDQTRKRTGRSLAGGALALLTAYPLAAAQLEEVIVTAQKREQSLQDVPVAVTAMSGKKSTTWASSGWTTSPATRPP